MDTIKIPVSLIVTATSRQSTQIEELDSVAFTFGNINIHKPCIDWFMNYTTATNTTDKLLDEILGSKAYAVSDGSYFPTSQTGACSWILATRDGSEWLKGGGIVPGCKEDQDPYRSDLGGQVEFVEVVHKFTLLILCAIFNIVGLGDKWLQINTIYIHG